MAGWAEEARGAGLEGGRLTGEAADERESREKGPLKSQERDMGALETRKGRVVEAQKDPQGEEGEGGSAP